MLKLSFARGLARSGSREESQLLFGYPDDVRAPLAERAEGELVDLTGVDFGKNTPVWVDRQNLFRQSTRSVRCKWPNKQRGSTRTLLRATTFLLVSNDQASAKSPVCLRPLPVAKITTSSLRSIAPRSTSFGNAANVAPASGDTKIPSSRAASRTPSISS